MLQGGEEASVATKRIAKGLPLKITDNAAERCHAKKRKKYDPGLLLPDIIPTISLKSPSAPGEQRIRTYPKSFSAL
jgi:hypothetical protein